MEVQIPQLNSFNKVGKYVKALKRTIVYYGEKYFAENKKYVDALKEIEVYKSEINRLTNFLAEETVSKERFTNAIENLTKMGAHSNSLAHAEESKHDYHEGQSDAYYEAIKILEKK